jgi:transcriptional regulator with XRE-family HTH domain
MPNERLRAAMRERGLTYGALAARLSVDQKTVERWVTKDVTPHRVTASNAAKLLDQSVSWLWPDIDDAQPGASNAEVVAFYPHRAQTPRTLWLELLRGAKTEIVLMAYASLFLPEENPESTRILRGKAANGVKIRIALGDPDTPEVALHGVEERLYEGLVGRVRMAIAYYSPLLGVPNIEFRLHRTTLYNSIFIYDNEMLINQHAYGVYGYMAPILHLRKVEGGDLFDMYAQSFDRVWQESYPFEPSDGRLADGATPESKHALHKTIGVTQVGHHDISTLG